MSQTTLTVPVCDLCGRPWIPRPGLLPDQCPKCRKRGWNVVEPLYAPAVVDLKAALRASLEVEQTKP